MFTLINKKVFLIFFILLVGVIVRLVITWNGNFIFHMDNARDMVDIREMVVLGKWRLVGPTSGIEGVFTGPIWYYMVAVPFILSGGDPYASIILQIIFWTIGGFFLLNIVKRWGILAVGAVGGIWVASDLIILNSQHSLSPNPIILLMPLFIYLLERYLSEGKGWLNIACWILTGLFFQLEMAWGIFIPPVMVIATFWLQRRVALKHITAGLSIFVAALLPQILFDLRHQFLMTQSMLNYLTAPRNSGVVDWGQKLLGLGSIYWQMYSGLLMNWKILIWGALIITALGLKASFSQKIWKKDGLLIACILTFSIPFLGYATFPIKVMAWHVQASMVVMLILFGYSLGRLKESGKLGKLGISGISLVVAIYSGYNIYSSHLIHLDNSGSSGSPSLLKNELAAVDHVYGRAQGRNFKVYTYMPSIIDYPYQYLFWWRGLKKYGYLPEDYAYLPQKPEYISGKNLLTREKIPESSNLVFLIKEPDQRGERHLWENNFKTLPLISTTKVGVIEIEERKEI